MSYYGSFSNSAFSQNEPFDARRTIAPAAEPYGSARYATTDSTWALNQTANIWSPTPQQHRYDSPQFAQPLSQPQYSQSAFEQPRYNQVFDQPLGGLSRPLNPMAGAADTSAFPRYSYMGGGSSLSSSYNSGRNDRYDDRRGGQRDVSFFGSSGGSSFRSDNRSGGGNRGNRNGGGDYGRQKGDRRRNDSDRAPRRVNEGSSPKQNRQKKDYGPSRIAPASGSSPQKERRDQPRDGRKPYGGGSKDGAGRGGGQRGNDRNTGRPMKRRNNKSTDLEFAKIPDDVESKSFLVKSENLVCFQGLQSVLTTQHEFPIVIDGNVYASVDHYYQIEKCRQLTDKDCEPLLATVQDEVKYKPKKSASSGSYGQLAREFLKENKIDREKIEEWRREGGVFVTYDAMRAKVQQCAEMRDVLKASSEKIIVHTFAGDAIFGSGTRVQFVHKWADEMAKAGGKIAISLLPLVDSEAISMAPQIAQGRNLLGLIHMQLAEEIAQGGLPLVVTAASLEMKNNGESAKELDISTVDISQEDEDELMKDE